MDFNSKKKENLTLRGSIFEVTLYVNRIDIIGFHFRPKMNSGLYLNQSQKGKYLWWILGWIQPFKRTSWTPNKVSAIVFPTVSLLPNLKQIDRICSVKGGFGITVWQAIFVSQCWILLDLFCCCITKIFSLTILFQC